MSSTWSARTSPAAERAHVDETVKDARLQELQGVLARQQKAAQDGMVGREVKVLFEKPGRLEGQMVGKSEYLHAVHVQAEGIERGEILPVRIVASNSNSLAGAI